MKKLLMLAAANMRKSKGQSFSLIILIFIAALLLNVGLLTALDYSKFFDKKAEELNTAHVIAAIPQSIYQDNDEDFFKTYPGVMETQVEDILLFSAVKFQYGSGSLSRSAPVLNADDERSITMLSLIGESNEANDRSIYVPYIFQTGGGYRLGDSFILTYGNKDYSFQIAGFTEDIMFGTTNSLAMDFYLPEESYLRFSKELDDETLNGVMLSAVLEDRGDAAQMIADFKKSGISSDGSSSVLTQDINSAKDFRAMTGDICSAIVIAFAIIVVFICVIVIRFRIGNSIEDSMTNIGALKACGYTSRQIMVSIMLQFCMLAFIGVVLGIAASYLTLPILSDLFAALTGLVWKQGFDAGISILGLVFILLVTVFVSWSSARRINRLHPIVALRGGIITHSFRKNYFPLDHKFGSLHLTLALKRLLQNLKQTVLIAFIFASVIFAAVFGLVMYYNFVVNDGAVRMIAGEVPSVAVELNSHTDNNDMLGNIEKMTGVRKALYYDMTACMVEYQEVTAYVTGDFAQTEGELIYEGRYPKHNNEIAINGYMAKLFKKKIGDTIKVTIGNAEAEYLISGFLQTGNFMGMDVAITTDGIKRLQDNYQQNSIYVYLSASADIDSFINELNEREGQQILTVQDSDEVMDSIMGAFTIIISGFVIAILVIIALVILLVLYLVIKTMILREKREFGIQKAVGYTTLQLMQQISLTFLPMVLCGVIVGGITGYFISNPMLSVLFRSVGIMKTNFTVLPLWIMVLGISITFFAYAISMLIAWRIRKISAYTLISE